MINTNNPLYNASPKNAAPKQLKPAEPKIKHDQDPKPSAPPLTEADNNTLQAFIDARSDVANIAAQILKERKQTTDKKGSVLNVLV